jgi:hypothetical protein
MGPVTWAHVQLLSGREWSVMLCGERRIEWDSDALVLHLKLVSNEQVLLPRVTCAPAR